MTLQPPQRAKTLPLAMACGLTGAIVVQPHRLHVNLTFCVRRGLLLLLVSTTHTSCICIALP